MGGMAGGEGAPAEGDPDFVKQRANIAVRGAVQGVGFRPFVYRLACDLKLAGWVLNSPQGVFVEIEGEPESLEVFLAKLQAEKPPRAFVQSLETRYLDPVGYADFEIRPSVAGGVLTALVLPDIAMCPDCLAEIRDPGNRRFRYPFTNCTNCGPRFTIIESLPYDRGNTSMRRFDMCRDCAREFADPGNRRFHAQPNACPECGPHLEFLDSAGNELASKHAALREAAAAIREGRIVAVKGVGGFHLMADARNGIVVDELRRRKHREEKPFALMYPTLDAVRAHCTLSPVEARVLTSAESPIVLVGRRTNSAPADGIAASVAPANPYLGVMLPYSPLHSLLLDELGFPVVATSGNVSDEPICTDEGEALERLRGIADVFLVHNRPILRHVDDSIVRVTLGRELVLRRARGYAPLPLQLQGVISGTLAVGGHLKNTVAVTTDGGVFTSQHIGDLENAEAYRAFQDVITSFENLYRVTPARTAADLHPDYASTRYAHACGRPVISVQHHFAHVLACMAENELNDPVLGVAWDGTGFGSDGTVWGGEFLVPEGGSFRRVACLRQFTLPGGDKAVREPRRSAFGLLYEIFGERTLDLSGPRFAESLSRRELELLGQMVARRIHAPWTSSAGRLFDAVASIVGLRQRVNYEGQAAMELEFALDETADSQPYPFALNRRMEMRLPPDRLPDLDANGRIINWEATILAVLADIERKAAIGRISRRFHDTLVEMILSVAVHVGIERVVLTGGCFQNVYLTSRTVQRLQAAGFRPYWHQRIPPNDGGIAVGQAVAASRIDGCGTGTPVSAR
jgi:hydrogenase maturation protein HypF